MPNVYVHFSQISFPARYSVVNLRLESHSLRFREVICFHGIVYHLSAVFSMLNAYFRSRRDTCETVKPQYETIPILLLYGNSLMVRSLCKKLQSQHMPYQLSRKKGHPCLACPLMLFLSMKTVHARQVFTA